jgi:hypothetical protein
MMPAVPHFASFSFDVISRKGTDKGFPSPSHIAGEARSGNKI